MLFRKKQPRCCAHCRYSTSITEEQVLCSKRGIRPPDMPCRRFKYDPLKRVPIKNATIDLSRYKQEDFIL